MNLSFIKILLSNLLVVIMLVPFIIFLDIAMSTLPNIGVWLIIGTVCIIFFSWLSYKITQLEEEKNYRCKECQRRRMLKKKNP